MTLEREIARLEEKIARYYERHSQQRVAMAAFIVGLSSIGSGIAVYGIFGNPIFGILGFALSGLVSVNLAMLFIVPPSKKLEEARQLICEAVRDRSRIHSFDQKTVKLNDADGNPRTLSGLELKVWHRLVVPFLVRKH